MKALKLPSAVAIIIMLGCLVAISQPANHSPADAATAWKQLQQAAAMPAVTQAETNREQQSKFYVDWATTTAVKAKAFYTQFPDSTNAIPAKMLECSMLHMAFMESMDMDARKSAFNTMANAQDALLTNSRLTDDQRLDLRMDIAARIRQDPQMDWKTRDADYERALRDLVKDYPKKDKAWSMLIIYAAEDADTNTMRSIASEVLAAPASDSTKNTARAILRRLDAVGKSLDMKFTALDGREVDLSQMKGKVVLVDFWATWCGPCVGEIPHVKEAYDKLHSRGFEVIGISFDQDENRLKDFVQTHELPWPQYFDGQTWKNKFGVQYAIDSIPTMWLVDKNGNLANDNARDDLEDNVEKLLAE